MARPNALAKSAPATGLRLASQSHSSLLLALLLAQFSLYVLITIRREQIPPVPAALARAQAAVAAVQACSPLPPTVSSWSQYTRLQYVFLGIHRVQSLKDRQTSTLYSKPQFNPSNKAKAWPEDSFKPGSPVVQSVRPDRPRLFAPASKWAALPALIAADPYLKHWNATIFLNATQYYSQNPVPYFMDGPSGILDNAREIKQRVKAFAYAYRMSNDTKWVNRCWQELQVSIISALVLFSRLMWCLERSGQRKSALWSGSRQMELPTFPRCCRVLSSLWHCLRLAL